VINAAGAGTRGERGVQMYERARICKIRPPCAGRIEQMRRFPSGGFRIETFGGVCFVGIDSEWDGHSESIPSRIHPPHLSNSETTHLTFIV